MSIVDNATRGELRELLAWRQAAIERQAVQIKRLMAQVERIAVAFEPVRQWYDGDGEGRDEDHTLDKMIGYAVADLERERLAALGAISMLRRHIKQLPADPITRERVRCEAVLAELDKPQ